MAVIDAFSELPRGRPTVNAIGVTLPTPCTRATAGATSAGIPCSLLACWFSMIRLPAKERLTALSIVAFVPAASTDTNATSAIPIVSAAAVTIVRPGWRMAFSRASRPVMPRQMTSTPIARASAGTTR